MALRALTAGKAALCSECGAEASSDASECESCHRPFEGYMDAVLCPLCSAVNSAQANACSRCGAKLPLPETTEAEPEKATRDGVEESLRRILQLSREKAKARGVQPPSPPGGQEPTQSLLADETKDDLAQALWKLSEPFSRMLESRRKRLQQMETLVDRARVRIGVLGGATNADEVHEREELKRQIEDLLLEKEDILRLEEGLVDMERTYRNVLRLQQEELEGREASLRGRMDAFRHELEARERTFGQLRERESEIARREDEFRRLTNRLHEREKELDQREEIFREKARLVDERHHALTEAEVDLERKRWEIQQSESRQASESDNRTGTTITVQPSDQDDSELRNRVSELEEQLERMSVEIEALRRERDSLTAFEADMARVMKDIDELLGQLPEEKIRSFARSRGFAVYERVLDRLLGG